MAKTYRHGGRQEVKLLLELEVEIEVSVNEEEKKFNLYQLHKITYIRKFIKKEIFTHTHIIRFFHHLKFSSITHYIKVCTVNPRMKMDKKLSRDCEKKMNFVRS